MRKIEQTRIIESLKTLREAHGELRKQTAPSSVTNLLADCQDFAMEIKTYIESIAGEGTKTAALLEDYCKLVYHASGERDNKDNINKLSQQLTAITSEARSELTPDKIEAAFFPYQLSMWDSLESVYLAAKEDPACDAYVIPIPWYEKNPNGTFGQMHYDGGKYPENIPVTDWQQYDVEERHPDVIFIHNPYDDGNYVSSVHPNFYSKRLRDCTDLLCYVPYFVTYYNVPKHFVMTAGCVYAHKVFLQSEKIRDTYARIYKANCGNQFGKPRDKFIASGSPKADRALSTKRGDCPLPPDWSRMIEGKQAVLYNTTIEALLKGDEQYLAKLRDVLDTFKERDDILLWWRPHPLIDSTLQSMRPQLLAKYREIVAEYKNKAWGIFDDTSDLHRAIAWCEAYYGDPSSVAYLFQVTGKPVMISCLAGNKETPPCIPFSYLVEGEGSLWFSTTIFNGLFKVDRETWQAEYLGSFPNEPLLQGNLYMKPAYGNGKIYFPPFNAKEIGVYSLSDQTFSKIAYDCPKDGEVKMAFTAAVFHEGYVYFTPYYYPAIMRLDTATGEITYHNEWLEPLQELVGTDKGELLVNPLVNGDTLMIPACKANAVLEFDMNTQTSTIREIGKKGTLYNGICYDGEHYWLSPRHCERLTKWNPRTGDTTEISVPHSDGADSPDAFTPIVYFQGHVWLFPRVRKARQTVKIDVQTGIAAIAEQFAHEDEKGVRSLQGHRYNYPHVTDDCIIEFNNLNGTLTEYKSENEVCRKGVIQYPPETLRQIKELRTKALFSCELAPFSMYDGRYYENIFAGLGDLLDYIVLFRGCDEEFFKAFRRLKLYWAEDRATDDTVGAVIYRCVREVACGRK